MDRVEKLAHVARPGMGGQESQGIGLEALDLPPEAGHGLLQRVVGQQVDIISPRAQGRQVDGVHRQSEVEVLTESAGLDQGRQISQGGRHHPGLEVPLAAFAHPSKSTLGQHPVELDLQIGGHVADLVEKESAIARRFEEAGVRLACAGERAASVAEQLALQELAGNGAAVEGHERPACPRTLVDGPGRYLLTGAALPCKQHGHIQIGHPRDEASDVVHEGAFADHLPGDGLPAQCRLGRRRPRPQ